MLNFKNILILICIFAVCSLQFAANGYAQDKAEEKQPITINGDQMDYSTDKKQVIVTGNAVVVYKGMKLSSDKLTMNIQTKEGLAEGHARLDEPQGVIEGEKMQYNFETKTGIIMDSQFRANPYFGIADRLHKVSEIEFIILNSYMTTCSMDEPHYRMRSKKVDFLTGDKMVAEKNIFYLGRLPIFYLPKFTRSLKEPLMHVRLVQGTSKDWGFYVLSAWRYSLTEHISGRVYFDYRDKLGTAEGFGANYFTDWLGRGDFKYYYTHEEVRPKGLSSKLMGETVKKDVPWEFERYLIRWRHKWIVDEKTDVTLEYHKITDSKYTILGPENGFLKDYFPREFEKDVQPLSYATLHHSFSYSSLNLLLQKRINRWYTQAEEMLPQISYSLPSYQIGDSPFYFDDISSYVNYNRKTAVPSPSSSDVTYNQFDTLNKFSLPMKMSIFSLTPYLSGQQIFNDKSTYGSTLQAIFSGGSDLSTKFYRVFNVNSNFLGLDINGLRHIITPTASYIYSKTSTMPAGKARYGQGASIGSSSVSLGLSNKLQTKRKGQSLDLADLRVTSGYNIKPKNGDKRGSSFSDFLFELELRPYSWLRASADATYNHTAGSRYSDPNFGRISCVNYDISLGFDGEHTIGIGHRYQRKGGNEITQSFTWRLNPKWKVSFYQRSNLAQRPGIQSGLREQEYSVTRDLHCWAARLVYNIKRGEGESILLVFNLKAFPELEFDFGQSYHQPRPGSQSNP